jgi:hypothetical protein
LKRSPAASRASRSSLNTGGVCDGSRTRASPCSNPSMTSSGVGPKKVNRPQIPNLFRPLDLTAAAHRACQGWPRLSRPPVGLGLDWPEHGGMLDRIETEAARPWREDAARGSFLPLPREAHRPKKYRRADRHIIGNFKPLALRQIHAAANTYRDGVVVSPAVPIFWTGRCCCTRLGTNVRR